MKDELVYKFKWLSSDSVLQLYQTLTIGSFLLIGSVVLGYIDILWWQIAMVTVVVMGLDFYLRAMLDGKKRFPFSAINTSIGICLFLRTEWWPILFFAGVAAITSKYLFCSGSKHFFNPSYSAIFLMLVLFPNEAYVHHFQWGNDWYILLPLLMMGFWVTLKAKLWDSVLIFWATLLLCLNLFVSYTSESFSLIFLTGSFLIISLNGFTDPATMPKRRVHRLLFSAQIAILFFILRQVINEGYSFFAAYFFVNLLEVGLWRLDDKLWNGYDLRLLVQGGLTILFFLVLFGMSLSYYFDTGGIWPRLLTNRCTQLFCV